MHLGSAEWFRAAVLNKHIGMCSGIGCRSRRCGVGAEGDLTNRTTALSVLALVVVGAGLRLPFLFQRMSHDEAETFVLFASRPLGTALSHYPFPNNHVFHTLLVHLSTGAFGNAPWVVRMPAFVAGLLLIPATFLAVERLYSRSAGLVAAGQTVCHAVKSGKKSGK
jgi:hypothetical protein